MDQKQLDFNAPLLSVRRFTLAGAASKIEENKKVQNSKKQSLTSYKPELKSGPVRNPGAVPFLWEQSPGRPKGGSLLPPKGPELPLLVPKLPPGRIVDVNSPSSVKSIDEKEVADMKVVKPHWNGRLTNFQDAFSSNRNINTFERSRRNDKEEQTVDSDNADDCNSDDFSDARDTLSHSESFFMNCSVSGLSASEGPGLKHSRRTPTDPQARDFMMDRFLPAAKAMASESPQYASRKQPVARQLLNSTRHTGNADVDRRPRLLGENKPPLHLQYTPYVKPVVQNVEGEYSDDDDGDDGDNDGADDLTAKACGILPQFFLRSSMFLLNPVAGMRIRRRLPMSSVGHKISTHAKTSSPEYLSEPDPETWEAVYRHKLTRGLRFPGTYDNGSEPTSESNQQMWWSDSQPPDGSSPYRHSTGEGISPFRNEASHSSLHEGMCVLGVPTESKNFKVDAFVRHGNSIYDDGGVLSYQSSKRGSGSPSAAIEKTLYVDSVRMLESSTSRCSSSDIKELMITREKNSELLVETERFNKVLTLQGHFEENHLKGFVEREALQLKASDCVESNQLSSSEESFLVACINSDKGFGVNDGVRETKFLDCSEALDDKSPNCNTTELLKVDQEIVSANSILPHPPPLPKSPSESWLCRTLPSVSSMNTFSRSYLGVQCRPKKQPQKASIADPKWETIVKTTNVRHGHVRFSEELKIHASNPSET